MPDVAAGRRVIVIGAGIVGVLCALRLRHDGFSVALIDPAPPGSGASSGNAGCLSPSSIVPLAGPGVWKAASRSLLGCDGPLALRLAYLPRAAPFLLRFARAGRPKARLRAAAALHALIKGATERWRTLAAAIGAGDLVRTEGSLVVYRDAASWRADAGSRALRSAFGVRFETLDGAGLQTIDPNLVAGLQAGLYFPDNGAVLDPKAFVGVAVAAFVGAGGELLARRATGFVIDAGRLCAVETNAGPMACDAAVLAAGAHSAALARALGHRLPLESERGYHLMLPAGGGPRLPTVDATRKIVATPMREGVRVSGIVEFAGLAAAPDWRRASSLAMPAASLFPGLAGAEPKSRWMGHRPSLPDSLPIIDRARASPDAILAFGHGHLGVTAAPMTAELVAALVADRPPAIDLSPYSARRFG